jgi:outer membrane protein TolC
MEKINSINETALKRNSILMTLIHQIQKMQRRILKILLKPIGLYKIKFKIFRAPLLISIYFNLFLNISVYSQSDSLYQYLEIAGKNNPGVLQKFSEYQAALQRVPQVGSLADPELSMGFFLSPMELVGGKQIADIRLMQMFPWFGVLKSAKDEMSLMANAKFELFRDTKLQLYYDVQRTWYELFKVEKNISISEKNLDLLKTIERLAIVKFSADPSGNTGASPSNSAMAKASQNNTSGNQGMQGMSSSQSNTAPSAKSQPATAMQSGAMNSSSAYSGLSDLYRIQIEAGELENNIASLITQKRTITAQFNNYLNRPAGYPVSIPEKAPADSLGYAIIAVSDSISAKNPMLAMLLYEEQSLEAKKKMVSRMGYPMVGLGLNYALIGKNELSTSAMNGKDMIMPMVTVTLPVYRKKYRAMVNESEILKTAAKQNYQSTANLLQSEYYQAIQLYQDAQRRMKLYNNQYLLASKSLDLILKNFSVSSAGLSDVLRVRQQTLDYELKEVEAVADLSIVWLKRLGNLESEGNK